jgi:hypothetical protein
MTNEEKGEAGERALMEWFDKHSMHYERTEQQPDTLPVAYAAEGIKRLDFWLFDKTMGPDSWRLRVDAKYRTTGPLLVNGKDLRARFHAEKALELPVYFAFYHVRHGDEPQWYWVPSREVYKWDYANDAFQKVPDAVFKERWAVNVPADIKILRKLQCTGEEKNLTHGMSQEQLSNFIGFRVEAVARNSPSAKIGGVIRKQLASYKD